MIIRSLTLNVRGLNDPRKLGRLRNFLQNVEGGLNVVMLQEHKLRGDRI